MCWLGNSCGVSKADRTSYTVLPADELLVASGCLNFSTASVLCDGRERVKMTTGNLLGLSTDRRKWDAYVGLIISLRRVPPFVLCADWEMPRGFSGHY